MHLHIVMPIGHLFVLSLVGVFLNPTCKLSRYFLFQSAFMFCLFIIFQLLTLNTFSTRYFKTILHRTSVVRVKVKEKYLDQRSRRV